jgi:DNA-binding response OmpR family regulator
VRTVEAQAFQIADLKRQLGIEEDRAAETTLRRAFGLSPHASRILLALRRRAPWPVAFETLAFAASGRPFPEGSERDSLRTQIANIRRALAAPIISHYGVGYALSADGVSRVDQVFGGPQ